jgi:hypothetical protein
MINHSPLSIQMPETGIANLASSISWLPIVGEFGCQLKEINTKISLGDGTSSCLASLVKTYAQQ